MPKTCTCGWFMSAFLGWLGCIAAPMVRQGWAGALFAVRAVLHGYAPSTRACIAHRAPIVPGLALPVVIMRWMPMSIQALSLSMVKLLASASITITRYSRNISRAAICSVVVACVMAAVALFAGRA